MAVQYTYAKEQDKHYFTNEEGTDITYSVTLKSDCVSFSEVASGTIAPAEKKLVTLSLDGDYEIVLTNLALETETQVIPNYIQLQNSMIQDIFEVLCGCECGCTPCSGIDGADCKTLMVLTSKVEAFKRLTAPIYDAYLATIYAETNCLIKQDIYCNINSETVTGKSLYNEVLLKKLIALDYLAIYFFESDQATLLATVEAIDYVKAKFMTNRILCCVSKLNIDITALRAKIIIPV